MEHTSTTSPSVTGRVAQTLLAFNGAGRWQGVSELARELGLSKSVVHRILQQLVQTGLVRYDTTRRAYALGPASVALGMRASAEDDLRAAAMPAISKLAEVTGETTTLSARIGYRRCYVAQIESMQRIRITVSIGEHTPLTVGASGICMLAQLPSEQVNDVLSLPIPSLTPRTPTDPEVLRNRLESIKEQGWATTRSEHVPLSQGIAAPITNADGLPAGSLSIGFLASRLEGQAIDKYAALVVEAAKRASQAYQRRLTEAEYGTETHGRTSAHDPTGAG
ncbi:IclR family transcriptional regulator [Nesterenkonia populi]|uniref:IclR family transcriptional regulator n=1 Tax=Nesterenkonia populi TaxID=1591087 RepID=UPI0014791FBC